MAFSFFRLNQQALRYIHSLNSSHQLPILPNHLKRLCSTHSSLKLKNPSPAKKDDVPTTNPEKTAQVMKSAFNAKYEKINEPLKQWTLKMLSGRIADPKALHSNQELVSVCSYLEKNVNHMTDYQLANILRSLLTLQFDPSSQLMRSVENEILWKMRKMSLRMILVHLELHLQYQETEHQRQMVQHLVEAIEKRVFELNPPILLKVLTHIHLFSNSFVPKIEDRALELVDKMVPEQLVKLLSLLCQAKLRPTSLLGGIAYYLTKQPATLSPSHCLDVLFSLNSLSYPHLELITKVIEDLAPSLDSLTRPKIITLLSLLGQLRWKDLKLLEVCCGKLISQLPQMQYREIGFMLNTLGTLQYIPENFEAIPNALSQHETSSAVLDYRWLNLVWNLAILGNHKFLASIHKPGLCTALLEDASGNNFKTSVSKLKLLNLNALALQQNPKGPNLFPQIGNVEVPRPALDVKLNEEVMACLYKFIPKDNYIQPDITCPFLGVHIDAEFIVDSSFNPVPYTPYGLLAGKTSQDPEVKPLPQGFKRVALLTLSFRNFILNSSEPLGKVALVERLLSGAGYTIVKVPFKEFDAQSTEAKKVEYLKNLIRNTCLDEANK